MLGKAKRKVFDHLGFRISRIPLKKLYGFKHDARDTAPFKLLFFCGKNGVNYLNASLISVIDTWHKLPEILVVTDGTPVSIIEKNIIDWPKKKEIITWETCARYFEENGNKDLHKFASEQIWGKKLVAILYHAKKHPVLYCDTDILWFDYPREIDLELRPCVLMCEDVEAFYDRPLLTFLKEEKCLDNTPLNAGLLFINGDFSSYPQWKELCSYLPAFHGYFAEQTTFAVLNNYFNPTTYWDKKNVLIKTDDKYSLAYTKKKFPGIFARHYVSNKEVTFWRDFVYMKFHRNKNPVH